MFRHRLDPTLLRSRWAAIGAAIAVSLGAGGLAIANAAVSSDPGLFHALSPVRVFDTREGTGGVPAAPIAAGATLDVQVGNRNGVPANATAVVLNVTVVGGTASSFLTVWPTGDARPTASSLNWTNAEARPNGVVVPLGTDGKVSFFNFAGTVHVLADVSGYYTAAEQPPFVPVVAQITNTPALPITLADVATVELTLPDVCSGRPDEWKVLVSADGSFLTSPNPSGTALVGLGTVADTFTSGTVANQSFSATGQWREPYSTSFLFTVDAGTTTFHQVGSNSTGTGIALTNNTLIAQSVSVSCPA